MSSYARRLTMRLPTLFEIFLLSFASTNCSRTPQPQTTPSATTQGNVATVPAPTHSAPVGPIATSATVDPDAIRSQEDCPERMIFIPGSKFEFTGPVPGDKDQSPKKQSFDIRPFCIDQAEAEYVDWRKKRQGDTIEQLCAKRNRDCMYGVKVFGPLTCVTPAQAECYCANITPGVPKRLPADAEFLYAALGTDGRLFPWGNELYPQGLTGPAKDFCAYEVNVDPKTSLCMPWRNTQDKSPFGVIGMATNGGELAVLERSGTARYVIRGVNHVSHGTPVELSLARDLHLLDPPSQSSPYLSFRCVVTRRP